MNRALAGGNKENEVQYLALRRADSSKSRGGRKTQTKREIGGQIAGVGDSVRRPRLAADDGAQGPSPAARRGSPDSHGHISMVPPFHQYPVSGLRVSEEGLVLPVRAAMGAAGPHREEEASQLTSRILWVQRHPPAEEGEPRGSPRSSPRCWSGGFVLKSRFPSATHGNLL